MTISLLNHYKVSFKMDQLVFKDQINLLIFKQLVYLVNVQTLQFYYFKFLLTKQNVDLSLKF